MTDAEREIAEQVRAMIPRLVDKRISTIRENLIAEVLRRIDFESLSDDVLEMTSKRISVFGGSSVIPRINADTVDFLAPNAGNTVQNLAGSAGASLVGFLPSGSTPTYGFASRTSAAKMSEIVSVKDFKNSNGTAVACDGVQDDTTGFQAAVDWFGSTAVNQRSGKLLIPGGLLISSTITVQNKSLIIEGLGWGNTQDTAGHASFIKWNGAAGSPMIKVINCTGLGIRDIRFVGKSTAKPTCAINYNQAASFGMESNWLTNVFIGSMSGDSSDDANQFTHGVLWDGVASNSAEYIFTNLHIRKCSGDGLHVGFSQNIDHTFNDLQIENCANGVFMCGNASGVNWRFSACTIDINQPFTDDNAANCNSYVNIVGYHSEGAGRLALLKGGSLCIIGGAFQITSSLNADGRVVDARGGGATAISNLTLREFAFTQASAPSASPYLDFSGTGGQTGGKCIILDGMEGWTAYMTGGTTGLTVNTGDATDVRQIYFRERMIPSAGTVPKLAQHVIGGVAAGKEWSISRYYVPNLYGPDNLLGDWQTVAGANGVTATFGIHASGNGGTYWNVPTNKDQRWRVNSVDTVILSANGIGYVAGVGGTVTQGAGSGKATTVVLSKVTGEITTDNAALNAGTTVSFTLTNTTIALGDHVIIQHVSGGTVGSYTVTAVAAAGSATIYLRNVTAGNLSEAIVLKFTVFKAATT